MNIFYLDSDPVSSARQICMVHVRKMIIESTQMLSTAHHVLDLGIYNSKELEALYTLGQLDDPHWYREILMKPSHANHPSSIWVRSHISHYKWLCNYTFELMSIYEEMRDKVHSCWLNRQEIYVTPPKNIKTEGFFVPPPACMPDEFKHSYSIAKSYRYYLNAKYNEWLVRERPIKVDFPYDTPKWFTQT